MIKKENFIIILFFCFFKEIVISYVVLPFSIKKKLINSTLPIEEQLEYFLEKDNIISTISFGEESKQLELYLTLKEYALSLSNDACLEDTNSSYNPLLSKTFKNTTDYMDLLINIKKYCRAIEKCTIFSDIYLNNNVSINNLSFIFGINMNYGKLDNSSKICGNLGLQLYNENDHLFKDVYFVNSLKRSKIINSYTWSIIYLNDTIEKNAILNYTNKVYDGLLICGINESDYFSIFKSNSFISVNAEKRFSSIYWDLTNINISYEYSNQKYVLLDNRITFNFERKYITCSKSFFNSINTTFFKNYIINNKCIIVEKLEIMGTNVIICQKEIMNEIKNFPKISFSFSIEKNNFIFELTSKDLFIEYKIRILFLIIYNEYGPDYWSLGEIFMRKYHFIFDYDKKQISFPKTFNINDRTKGENENLSFNNYSKIIIIFVLIILGIIFGVLIGKYLWNNRRKKRANELVDDDFEYIQNDGNENLKNNNKKIKQIKDNSLF